MTLGNNTTTNTVSTGTILTNAFNNTTTTTTTTATIKPDDGNLSLYQLNKDWYKDWYTIDSNIFKDNTIFFYNKEPSSPPPPTYRFKNIKEIVPEKIYEFTFIDGSVIKTILDKQDTFNLEYAFYLALAKKLYKDIFTFEGVLNKVYQLQFQKKYVKEVEKGIKLFKNIQKEEAKKKEEEEIKKRQHERYIRRKKQSKERKEQKQIDIIAQAIRLSKDNT